MIEKPKKQRHRGKSSQDDKLFQSEKQQEKLRKAVFDLSFLLERGYAEKSASILVGNRYQLAKRQIQAVTRMSVAQSLVESRLDKKLKPAMLKGEELIIDGFNLLIGLEVALSGGYLFEGMDSCLRDIAGVHATYRSVSETLPAFDLLVKVFKELEVSTVRWYFDKPVSNSGRIKTMIYEIAEKYQLNWTAETVNNPDKMLVEINKVSITSDGWILDRVDRWINLLEYIVNNHLVEAAIIKACLPKT